jgi:hypothetical protein
MKHVRALAHLIRFRPRAAAALGLVVIAGLCLSAVRTASASAASSVRSSTGTSSEHNPGWVGTWESAQTVADTSGLRDQHQLLRVR